MTRNESVLLYIETYGSISSLEAYEDLKIRNLRVVILSLKKAGTKIVSKWCVANDKGNTKYYKRYKIASRFKLFDRLRGYNE